MCIGTSRYGYHPGSRRKREKIKYRVAGNRILHHIKIFLCNQAAIPASVSPCVSSSPVHGFSGRSSTFLTVAPTASISPQSITHFPGSSSSTDGTKYRNPCFLHKIEIIFLSISHNCSYNQTSPSSVHNGTVYLSLT